MAGTAFQRFDAAESLVRAQAQPGGELLLCPPTAHSPSHFRDHGLRSLYLYPIDLCKVHTGNAIQLCTQIQPRHLLSMTPLVTSSWRRLLGRGLRFHALQMSFNPQCAVGDLLLIEIIQG